MLSRLRQRAGQRSDIVGDRAIFVRRDADRQDVHDHRRNPRRHAAETAHMRYANQQFARAREATTIGADQRSQGIGPIDAGLFGQGEQGCARLRLHRPFVAMKAASGEGAARRHAHDIVDTGKILMPPCRVLGAGG